MYFKNAHDKYIGANSPYKDNALKIVHRLNLVTFRNNSYHAK